MTKNNPKVSVLLPAYNAEAYISTAIDSILNQTFKDFELIVIDDNSTDKTADIIKNFASKDSRVVFVHNEQNLKISATLNKGIAMAQGEYIARMDADDEALPDRLKKQSDYLTQHKDTVIVGASINICDSNLKKINVRQYNEADEDIRKKIFRYGQFCHPVVMMRRSTVQDVGGYNTDLYDAEDYDLFFRLGKYGDMANLSDILLNYRTSNTSVSATRAKRQELLTLYVRLKAHNEYGYRMSFSDKVYLAAQYVSVYLIPSRLKFWLFNFIRRTNG